MPGDEYEVTAWQFSKTQPIPAWVFRNFHRCGGEGWTAIAMQGQMIQANVGDWAVLLEGVLCTVLTSEEFNKCYAPLNPENPVHPVSQN